jgi:tetratricopeptide (TPR) repeat protein
MVRLYFDWDWPAAGRELERAVELDPNDSVIRHGYGDYLLVMGKPEEALRQMELGRQGDPASPIAAAPVVGHLLFLRRYDEVIEEARLLLESDSNFPLVREFLVEALWIRGEHDEALRLLRERWSVRAPEILDALDRGYRESGPSGAVLAIGDFLASEARAKPANPMSLARYFAWGGDLDRAFEALERAIEEREPGVLHVMVFPGFDVLKSDPRFTLLMDRVGLPPTQEAHLAGT